MGNGKRQALAQRAKPRLTKNPSRNKLEQKLGDALDEDEIEKALQLIRSGADPNACGEERLPALLAAMLARGVAHEERILWLKELLSIPGIDVNAATTVELSTCLHEAARRSLSEVFDQLLKLGADVNARDCQGNSPLHCAVMKATFQKPAPEQDECVNILLSRPEIEIDAVNDSGESSLLMAAKCGYEFGCKALLDSGADISKVTNDGKSVLDCAVRSGNKRLVEEIQARMASADITLKLDMILPPGA
jgi:ankyrin repeat protein